MTNQIKTLQLRIRTQGGEILTAFSLDQFLEDIKKPRGYVYTNMTASPEDNMQPIELQFEEISVKENPDDGSEQTILEV